MAALGTVVKREGPYDSARKASGVVVVMMNGGSGADLTTIVTAVTGKQIVITGGSLVTDGGGAETLVIQSDANVIYNLELPAAAAQFDFPKGLYTNAGEALKFNKSAAGAAVSFNLEYVTVSDGQYLGLL